MSVGHLQSMRHCILHVAIYQPKRITKAGTQVAPMPRHQRLPELGVLAPADRGGAGQHAGGSQPVQGRHSGGGGGQAQAQSGVL